MEVCPELGRAAAGAQPARAAAASHPRAAAAVAEEAATSDPSEGAGVADGASVLVADGASEVVPAAKAGAKAAPSRAAPSKTMGRRASQTPAALQAAATGEAPPREGLEARRSKPLAKKKRTVAFLTEQSSQQAECAAATAGGPKNVHLRILGASKQQVLVLDPPWIPKVSMYFRTEQAESRVVASQLLPRPPPWLHRGLAWSPGEEVVLPVPDSPDAQLVVELDEASTAGPSQRGPAEPVMVPLGLLSEVSMVASLRFGGGRHDGATLHCWLQRDLTAAVATPVPLLAALLTQLQMQDAPGQDGASRLSRPLQHLPPMITFGAMGILPQAHNTLLGRGTAGSPEKVTTGRGASPPASATAGREEAGQPRPQAAGGGGSRLARAGFGVAAGQRSAQGPGGAGPGLPGGDGGPRVHGTLRAAVVAGGGTAAPAGGAPSGSTYRRAQCRYTLRGTPQFVGLDVEPSVPVNFTSFFPLPLQGNERARMAMLLSQTAAAAGAVRGGTASATGTPAGLKELPALIRDLARAFVQHKRSLLEPNITTLETGVPVGLALLAHMSEALNALVVQEEDSQADFGARRGSSVQAADEVPEALGRGFVDRGLVAEMLDCLVGGRSQQALDNRGAHAVALELGSHAALVLRLAMEWAGTPKAKEAFRSAGGLEALHETAQALHLQVQELGHPQGEAAVGMAQLALVLGALRLGLRGEVKQGPDAAAARGGSLWDAPTAVLATAVGVLETLAQLHRHGEVAPEEDWLVAADATAAAAVRLLAAATDLPAKSFDMEPAKVAKALHDLVGAQPLTPRLAAAIHYLVRKPNRKRAWATATAGARFDRNLRQALGHASVPQECVLSALLALDLVAEGSGKQEAGLMDVMARNCDRLQYMGALYRNVEAIAVTVHGHSAGAKLMSELRALKEDEMSSSGIDPEGHANVKPPVRRMLQLALGRLQRSVLERTKRF